MICSYRKRKYDARHRRASDWLPWTRQAHGAHTRSTRASILKARTRSHEIWSLSYHRHYYRLRCRPYGTAVVWSNYISIKESRIHLPARMCSRTRRKEGLVRGCCPALHLTHWAWTDSPSRVRSDTALCILLCLDEWKSDRWGQTGVSRVPLEGQHRGLWSLHWLL